MQPSLKGPVQVVSDIADDGMNAAPPLTKMSRRDPEDDSVYSPRDSFDAGSVYDLENDFDDGFQESFHANKWAQTVTVHAGRDKTPFELHIAPLTKKSTFFRNALKPARWNEGDQKLVCLAKISAEYFKMYTYWVYTSKLDYAALGYRQNGDDFVTFEAVVANGRSSEMFRNVAHHLEKTSEWANRLIVLWVHAEFLGDAQLQNAISEELEKWWFQAHYVVSIRSFAFVDKHTSPESPLRKLCIDWADLSHVFRSRVGSQDEVQKLPKWLLSQLLLMRMRRERGTLEDDPRTMDLTKRGRYYVR